MKKLIIWLAKIFDVNITKIEIKEVTVTKEVQVALDNEVIKFQFLVVRLKAAAADRDVYFITISIPCGSIKSNLG